MADRPLRFRSFGGPVGTVIILVAGLALLWLSVAVTAAHVLGRVNPSAALGWWPLAANARAHLADRTIERNVRSGRRSAVELAQAREAALAALGREPVNVTAARSLGALAEIDRQPARAARLFRYAESVSRRNLPVELWLIEERVRANDANGALRHYDRALRVSPASGEILYPVLVGAAADPAVAAPLATLVARRPPWWGAFLDKLIWTGRSPDALARVIAALGLRFDAESDRHFLNVGLTRLVALGDYDRAFHFYVRSRNGLPAAERLIRNGSFERDVGAGPFDWSYVDEPGLAGIRQAQEGAADARALVIVAQNGRAGVVARQLLVLAPGRYRLTARAGNVSGSAFGRPQIEISCDRHNPPVRIASARLPDAPPAGAPFRLVFGVPSGCGAQRLEIHGAAGFEGGGQDTWIDDISITPAGTRP